MKLDAVSGLILPEKFIDEKQSLKKSIDSVVDQAVYANQHIRGTYYLTVHAKFDRLQPDTFTISPPIVTKKLPPFISNQMVFWVSNEKGICELLWMVPPKKKGQKLKVEFNKSGVAYLQAKGAMPS
jgi:hypothetical protein